LCRFALLSREPTVSAITYLQYCISHAFTRCAVCTRSFNCSLQSASDFMTTVGRWPLHSNLACLEKYLHLLLLAFGVPALKIRGAGVTPFPLTQWMHAAAWQQSSETCSRLNLFVLPFGVGWLGCRYGERLANSEVIRMFHLPLSLAVFLTPIHPVPACADDLPTSSRLLYCTVHVAIQVLRHVGLLDLGNILLLQNVTLHHQ
jgi:hypothetical protein